MFQVTVIAWIEVQSVGLHRIEAWVSSESWYANRCETSRKHHSYVGSSCYDAPARVCQRRWCGHSNKVNFCSDKADSCSPVLQTITIFMRLQRCNLIHRDISMYVITICAEWSASYTWMQFLCDCVFFVPSGPIHYTGNPFTNHLIHGNHTVLLCSAKSS